MNFVRAAVRQISTGPSQLRLSYVMFVLVALTVVGCTGSSANYGATFTASDNAYNSRKFDLDAARAGRDAAWTNAMLATCRDGGYNGLLFDDFIDHLPRSSNRVSLGIDLFQYACFSILGDLLDQPIDGRFGDYPPSVLCPAGILQHGYGPDGKPGNCKLDSRFLFTPTPEPTKHR